MFDIFTLIPGKKKNSASGWTSFNAVCCQHRGHKQDRRMRGGIRRTDDNGWVYNCFNCNFKCSLQIGKSFSKNLRQLLGWCGIDVDQINRWSFESFQEDSGIDLTRQRRNLFIPNFHSVELPEGSIKMDPNDPDHQLDVNYLRSRGVDPYSFDYYITPDAEGRNRNRIIIPYTWQGVNVGYTSRFYDGRQPKYISEQQRGYVFNIDRQDPAWQVCILVEGQFDAISIGGCAYMGSNISDEQAQLLARYQKTYIVVPDRDKSGLSICDRALELGYHVSIPNWSEEIKDVNDAVSKYGRLATTLSILEHATTSKIKIEMLRKKLV